MADRKKLTIWGILGRILTAVVGLALAAAFFLAMVLGQPQEAQQEAVDLHQPLTSAAPTRQITHESQLA